MGKVIRMPRRYNQTFDAVMLMVTLGLWYIWMLIRPKYY